MPDAAYVSRAMTQPTTPHDAAASRADETDAAEAQAVAAPARRQPAGWTFFSNHAHVLFCLSAEPTMLLRDIAARVGVTERAVLRIVAELEQAGVLRRQRQGRRNRYVVMREARLRHAVEAHCTVGELLSVIHRS